MKDLPPVVGKKRIVLYVLLYAALVLDVLFIGLFIVTTKVAASVMTIHAEAFMLHLVLAAASVVSLVKAIRRLRVDNLPRALLWVMVSLITGFIGIVWFFTFPGLFLLIGVMILFFHINSAQSNERGR